MTEHAALLFQLDIEESQLDCLQADLRRSVENTPTKWLSVHHMTSNFLLQSLDPSPRSSPISPPLSLEASSTGEACISMHAASEDTRRGLSRGSLEGVEGYNELKKRLSRLSGPLHSIFFAPSLPYPPFPCLPLHAPHSVALHLFLTP